MTAAVTAETPTTPLSVERHAELEVLHARHGVLRAEDVVEFARDPNTALHSVFTWDDTEAAHRYRLIQAMGYIRCVARVLPAAGSQAPVKVRAYVSLPSERGANEYRSVVDVLNDDDRRRELVSAALNEYQAFRTKYRHLSDLAGLFDAADREAAKLSA